MHDARERLAAHAWLGRSHRTEDRPRGESLAVCYSLRDLAPSNLAVNLYQDEETSETLPDVAQLDAKIAEAEEAMAKAETSAEKRKAKERKEDLMRLKRVETIYVRLWATFRV